MAGPGICVLCLADTCTSEVHPVFNPVAPYGYLFSDKNGQSGPHGWAGMFDAICTAA